ncbi:MAG: sugar phosphate nucleotidyltransferase [Omnitrophica bacterium]|nr:sugar phosphate nucleotidyltransferase [Candidatus Omnitrophota bacterium]
MEKITAIILAAGKGTRMRSTLPKALQELNSKPLIYYILKELSSLDKYIGQIIVVVGHKADLVQKYIGKNFKDIDFVIQRDISGTASAVKCTKSKVRCKKVLIVCGDSPLITRDTLKLFIRFSLKKNPVCSVVTAYMDEENDFGAILRDKNGNACAVCERIDRQGLKVSKEVNSGIYSFDTDLVFEAIDKIKKNPRKKEYFFTDIVEVLYREKYTINTYFLDEPEEVMSVNSKSDLVRVQGVMQKRVINKLIDSGVKIIDPQTTFIAPGVKIGKNTVIYPFTFIERNVIIGNNCLLGPFIHLRGKTSIAANTHLGNFLEVNRSRLGKKVKAKHFGYLGDVTVGDNVNIGAGTVVANFDGKAKNKTSIKKNAFIGSDTILVAPVKIGEKSVTGAGSVVTKNVKPNTVVAGVPARILKKSKR